VLRRRMAEAEEKTARMREAQQRAVDEVVDDSNGKKGGLLGRGGNAKAVETLAAQLRSREIELEETEKRLEELRSSLQRREADLNAYARKIQQSVGSEREAAREGSRPAAADTADGGQQPPDATSKRLQFWSR